MRPKIIKNKIRCRTCGDVLESVHTHDFHQCSCKKVAIDGGREYLKRLGDPTDYEELSEIMDASIIDIIESVDKITPDPDLTLEEIIIKQQTCGGNDMEDSDDFDRGFPNSVYTVPNDTKEPRYNWRRLIAYCEEKGIKTSELTPEELRMFKLKGFSDSVVERHKT